MTVIYFGSSPFSVLPLRSISESVDCVVTRKIKPKGRGYLLEDNEVKREALELGIPIIEMGSFKEDEARQIGELNPDLLVVASFGLFIPRWFLDIPKIGAINIHPSLLPLYRGPSPIQWAIWNGEKETGITIMKMNERMDAGDILHQATVAIGVDEDAENLSHRLSQKAAEILPKIVRASEVQGLKEAKPQDDALATFSPMITKEMGRIDWQLSSPEISRRIRALVIWPTAYTMLEGKTVKIFKAREGEKYSHNGSHQPGQVLGISSLGIDVAALSGTVVIEEIQLENRRRMKAAEFARGYRQIVGKRFE
jgi:methionyl-tRNA formyltransferase